MFEVFFIRLSDFMYLICGIPSTVLKIKAWLFLEIINLAVVSVYGVVLLFVWL